MRKSQTAEKGQLLPFSVALSEERIGGGSFGRRKCSFLIETNDLDKIPTDIGQI
jgi:hypothetical protein